MSEPAARRQGGVPLWLKAVIAAGLAAALVAGVVWSRRAPATTGGGPDSGDPPLEGALDASVVSAAVALDAGVKPPPGPLPVLRGVVRDSVGGVAQAELRISIRGSSTESEPCASAATTRSVGGGGFELGPLCPGQYDLSVERGGQQASAVVRLRRGPPQTGQVLELADSVALVVRVETETHQPLAGAEVEVQDETSGFRSTALTGADGSARFEHESPRPHTIGATAAGYLHQSLSRRAMAAGKNEVRLTLAAGLQLTGRVLGPDGAPVIVDVTLAMPRTSRFSRPDVMVSASSVDGGTFTLGPVLRGSYLILVDDEPWEALEQPVKLPSGPVTLKLTRGATLEGEFLDEQGTPVRHAELWFMIAGGGSRMTKIELADEGVFRLEGVRSGKHSVVAMASADDGGQAGTMAASFEARAGQTTHLALRLERGLTITGTCSVDHPPENGGVSVYCADEELYRRVKWNDHPETFSSGSLSVGPCTPTFEVHGLHPGRYALLCDGEDEPRAWARAGEAHVAVRCAGDRGRPKLRFSVTDEQGRAITSFGLSASILEDHPGGKYEDSFFESGPFVLKVFAPGYATFEREVRPQPNSDLELGALVLTHGRTVSGHVLAQGTREPVEGAVVSFAVASDSAEQLTRTAADGSFTLTAVPSTESEVHVEHPAWLPRTVPVGASQAQLEIELGGAARLVGTVVTRDGRLTQGLKVTAAAAAVSLSAPIEHGMFELGPLPVGHTRVRIEGAESFSPAELEVKGPGELHLDFVERLSGASFAVDLVDDTHQQIDAQGWLVPGVKPRPNSQAEVKLLIAGDALGSDHNEQGQLTFSAVPPGTWTLLARPERDPGYLYSQVLTVSEGMASVLHATLPMTPLPP